MERFPEPVSGQVIPRGWFGRLVRFINSLILHGDGQYLTVKHTLDGQTITPTPALLQALGNGGAPPAASGGAPQDISAAVSGGTLTLFLSGSTSAVRIVGAGAASIAQDPFTGDVTLSVSGGGGSIPDWTAEPAYSATLDPIVNLSTVFTASTSGYLQIYANFYSGSADPQQLDLTVEIDGATFTVYSLYTEFDSIAIGSGSPYSMPVAAGSTVTCTLRRSGGPFYPAPATYDFTGTASVKFYT